MDNQSFILGKDSYKFTIGVLEYDTQHSSKMDTKHRQFLVKDSQHKKITFLNNNFMDRLIQINYRLLYLKEVVFSQTMDDNQMKFRIYGLIYKNYEMIFEFLLNDKSTVINLVNKIREGDTDCLQLVIEINDTLKNNQLLSNYQNKFWDMLNQLNVFEAVENVIRKVNKAIEENSKNSKNGSRGKNSASKKGLNGNKPTFQMNGNKQSTFGGNSSIAKFMTTEAKFSKITPQEALKIETLCIEMLLGSLDLSPNYLRKCVISPRQKTLSLPMLRYFISRLETIKEEHLKNLYLELFRQIIYMNPMNNPNMNGRPQLFNYGQLKQDEEEITFSKLVQEAMLVNFTERLLKNISYLGNRALTSLQLLNFLADTNNQMFKKQILSNNDFLEYIFNVLDYKEKQILRLVLQLLNKLVLNMNLTMQNKLLTYLKKFYQFFLKMRKKGLLFNMVLEFSNNLCQQSALLMITYINEELTGITENPYFLKYLSKIINFYSLYKQGRTVDEIVEMFKPQPQEVAQLDLNINQLVGVKRFQLMEGIDEVDSPQKNSPQSPNNDSENSGGQRAQSSRFSNSGRSKGRSSKSGILGSKKLKLTII